MKIHELVVELTRQGVKPDSVWIIRRNNGQQRTLYYKPLSYEGDDFDPSYTDDQFPDITNLCADDWQIVEEVRTVEYHKWKALAKS